MAESYCNGTSLPEEPVAASPQEGITFMKLGLTFLHQHESALDGMLETLFESMGLSHQWTEFLLHFITDIVNLFLILFVVMFAVSLLQTYIPFDRLKKKLSALGSVWGYLLALALGVASPFCSCTIIPVVMGLISVGVPVQVALCYLTSAALLNGGAVVTLFSTMGAQFGGIYVAVSVLIAVLTSILIRPFAGRENIISYDMGHHHGDHCHDDHCHDEHCNNHSECSHHEPKSRVGYCVDNVWHVLRQTWLYMILSVALSSAVISFVPIETLNTVIGQQNVLSPLLAGLIGAPIHADVFSILPLLQLLRPINFSATMAFALGAMAISIPEVVLLSRVFKAKTIAAYAVLLVALSVAAGYVTLLVL
ncbi:permease [Hydrogenoanaerobacterium sp.]|uniref:permease n=1 Tax=Hydrogenoanaerobacterium sp. TaxID=2953763 RepID=UPI0028A0E9C8|nr:permease [Hydrogenoanaerobacterium sp.]